MTQREFAKGLLPGGILAIVLGLVDAFTSTTFGSLIFNMFVVCIGLGITIGSIVYLRATAEPKWWKD